ncbi:MAG TPA: methanol--corrinoid methyltransferase [Clostridiaceae bacterium]|nr:methanol--corrinoid methyltransferase [Clostridiaceae bacterium]
MPIKQYASLAYNSLDEFVYGYAKNPIKLKNGMVIGGGKVYPELNFTLPPMLITKDTMPEVLKQYKEIIEDACKRAKELYLPGLVVEVELLPPTTYNPEWGIDITKTIRDVMYEYEAKYGLKSVMRITPVDIREDKQSPHMWHGSHWDAIMKTFEGCARAGADLLSIESIGGKDLHDDAIMFCELDKSIFSLGVLGAMDMAKLWGEIKAIADQTGAIAAGDTACGFANTAMVLADRGFVPKLFAAVVRAISAVRSLVAIEEGAIGPHKDCGYEGVYIKAITGIPISMEGKSSACAHLSPVGNIAACAADLWSNESVQNIKLLGGMAPTVSLEQIAYDCRLMNVASSKGIQKALELRDWLAESDSSFDPQAYILSPEAVFQIAKAIIKENTYYKRAKAAAATAIDLLRKATESKKVIVDEREISWLDMMESQLDLLPDDEEEFIHDMVENNRSDKFVPEKYDL